MLSVGDIVVQRGGATAGRIGSIIVITRSGYVLVRDATGKTFRCQHGNVRTVLDLYTSATVSLKHAARKGTQLQFFTAMVEWTRLAQLCLGLGLGAEASRLLKSG